MPNFRYRSQQAELMDDLTLASDDLRRNLDELEIINTWLGGYAVVLNALSRLLPTSGDISPATYIADLGSGGGDTLRAIARWGRKHRHQLVLVGIDANVFMIDYAAARTHAYPEISFRQGDVFEDLAQEQGIDIAVCSLFCHHFSDTELVRLFKHLYEQTRLGFIINDLHRHWLAYYSIKFLTRVFGGSYLVQHDAPLSVWRAFRKQELEHLLEQAGIEQYSIRWRWAFRWEVIVKKAKTP